jgi:hypothetical protein
MARITARPSVTSPARVWVARLTRRQVARAGVAVLLFVVAALLWMLIVSFWAEAAGRAVPPVGVVAQAAGWSH